MKSLTVFDTSIDITQPVIDAYDEIKEAYVLPQFSNWPFVFFVGVAGGRPAAVEDDELRWRIEDSASQFRNSGDNGN